MNVKSFLCRAVMALLLAVPAGPLMAAGKSQVITTDGSCTITIDSWLEHVPPTGWMPMTVRVTNYSDQPRNWVLSTIDNDYMSGEMRGTFAFGAPAKGASTTSLLVPVMADFDNSRSYSNLRCTISGPALQGPGMFYLTSSSSRSSGSSGKTPTAFLGVSEVFENTRGAAWRRAGFSGGREFSGDTVNMATPPSDWRGYSSLAQLWMTDGEWSSLSAMQHQALMTWVAHGGLVVVSAKEGTTTLPLPEGFPAWKGEHLEHGMGQVRLIAGSSALEKNANSILELERTRSVEKQATSQPAEAGRLASLLPPLKMNTALIFTFILIFGIVVGPVNLFWFAAGNRRPRMFWTTPLISFIGAAVLVVVMILQDGFGGTGARVSLAVVLPEQKQMAVLQEQFAKTGILLSRTFDLPSDGSALITQLPNNQQTTNRFGVMNPRQEKRNLALTNSTAGGGWFTSRALQSMLVQDTRMNRGGIEFVPGDKPAVINSLPTTLKKLVIQDNEKRLWMASNVRTGERVALQPTDRKTVDGWITNDVVRQMGMLLRDRIKLSMNESGSWFFAEAAEPAKLATPTLDSIRWDLDRAFVTGRLTP
ncbi:MAG: hypothetical protein JNM99_07325 [Verrucomicrobiaceae bacterium]|nr:hypothetical protein [Verrucomicrobiaceae bacterium]